MNQREKNSFLHIICHFKKKWSNIDIEGIFSVVFFFPRKEGEITLRIQGEIFKHEDI